METIKMVWNITPWEHGDHDPNPNDYCEHNHLKALGCSLCEENEEVGNDD